MVDLVLMVDFLDLVVIVNVVHMVDVVVMVVMIDLVVTPSCHEDNIMLIIIIYIS